MMHDVIILYGAQYIRLIEFVSLERLPSGFRNKF